MRMLAALGTLVLCMALGAPAIAATQTPAPPVSARPVSASADATAADPFSADIPAGPYDPIEPVNRGVFGFNKVADGVLLKPLAHIYLGVVPEPAQHGLHNVLSNLSTPVVLLNSVLQWDLPNAGVTLERFLINSTVGVAGLFDVASDWGIEKSRRKDFGQTLGVYGVAKGAYLVLPILGSSDVRDTFGLVADFLSDPLTYVLTTDENIIYDATRAIVTRAEYLPATDQIERDSFDPYATYRSIYLQRRDRAVREYKKNGEDETGPASSASAGLSAPKAASGGQKPMPAPAR